MRFQDWDILLFPAGEGAAHSIPLQEFRTACYSEQHDPNSPYLTPLLTTFVPSLEPGAAFQISLHSWTKTANVLVRNDKGSKPREVWQVRVVVDGQTVANEHLPMAGSWPQVICKCRDRRLSDARALLTERLSNSQVSIAGSGQGG